MVEKSDRHKHVNVMKETGQKIKKKKLEGVMNLLLTYIYFIII